MKKVNIISTVVQRQISGEKIPTGNNVTLNGVVDIDEIRKELSKNFISFDDFKSYWEIKTDAYGNKYIYSPLHIATQNGITMYTGKDGVNIPSIYDGLPIDSQTIYWEDIKDGNGVVVGKILKANTGGGTLGSLTNIGEWADSVASVDRIMVQKQGSDKWVAMDASKLGTSASFENIFETGEGNAYTSFTLSDDKKSLSLVKGQTFITASESEDITGIKNFINGLRINGVELKYDSTNNAVFIQKSDGGPVNFYSTGGISMYGQGNTSIKTIMDAITANLDTNTLAVKNGLLTVVGGTGSIASITKQMVIDALGFTPYDASNPNGYITSASLSGLNADTLDGKHDGELTALFVAKQNATTDDFRNYLKTYGNKGFSIVENSSGGDIGNIGTIYTAVNFGSQLSRLGRFIFCRNDNSNELYFQAPKSDLSDWGLKNRIAFVNSNVESATKLETPRTIWGQSFDGSKNVDGKLFVTISTKANSNSDAAIGAKSTYAENSFCRPLSFLFPNALAGAAPHVYMGVEDSQYNGGYFGFKYIGKGDASNYITLGLYSADNIIVANGYGNVGIGTLSPSYKLHVNGNQYNTGDLKLGGNCLASFFGKSVTDVWSDGTNSHTWYGYDHRYPNTGVYSTTISDYFGMMFRTVNTTLCLTKSGCVGINTDSPSASLHVAGNILATGGITMYSQRSLKNIVDERSLSLLELSTIKPTRYTWKDGRDNNIHIGGIADDVKQVLPEVVYKTADGTLTMDYGNAGFAIAASLIKPVIDHDKRIKALERENELLKQKLNRLRA